MQTDQIVSLLIAERDRLSQAIDALQGDVVRRSQTQTPSALSKPVPGAPVNGAPKKRRISAAGRKAIADAARRRWAAIRAAKAAPKNTAPKAVAAAPAARPAKKRQISPAARKAMVEGAKKRWVAIKKVAPAAKNGSASKTA
jgi:hypothetical protein